MSADYRRSTGLPRKFSANDSEFHRELAATTVDPSDTFLIPDDQKKIYTKTTLPADPSNTPSASTKLANAHTFFFNREDHTLASLLVSQLRKNPQVEYAAYKLPHPLSNFFELRIHLHHGPCAIDSYNPKTAIIDACRNVLRDLDTLATNLSHELGLVSNMRAEKAAAKALETSVRNGQKEDHDAAESQAVVREKYSQDLVDKNASESGPTPAAIHPSRSGYINGSAENRGSSYAAQYASSYNPGTNHHKLFPVSPTASIGPGSPNHGSPALNHGSPAFSYGFPAVLQADETDDTPMDLNLE